MTVKEEKLFTVQNTPFPKSNRLICDIGFMLLSAGIICFAAKAAFGARVAENGALEEKFFLLPVGFMFILCAALCFVFCVAMTAFAFFKTKEKAFRAQCLQLLLVCFSALTAIAGVILLLLWANSAVNGAGFSLSCFALSALSGIAAFFFNGKVKAH